MANATAKYQYAKKGWNTCRWFQPKPSDLYEKPRQKMKKTINHMGKVVEQKILALEANCTVESLEELEKIIQEHRM